MIGLTEQQLYDFLKCPLLFHTKHMLKIAIKDPITIKVPVRLVMQYFYSNLLNGKVKTLKELQLKWDSYIKQYQLDNKEIVAGWGKILKAASWCQEKKIIVGDVNCFYKYNVDFMQVKGQIDTIFITPNNQIELFYLDLGEHHLDKIEEHRKVKYALDYYGFQSAYDRVPDRVHVHNLKYDEDVFISFDESDKKRLDSIVYNVGKCIENKYFYPHETYLCNKCGGKYYCRCFTN